MAATDPMTSEPRRLPTGLPRPLSIGIVTAVLIAAAVGLRFGLPSYRQLVFFRDVERLGGHVETRMAGSQWVRDRLGHKLTEELFDKVIQVNLSQTKATDNTLVNL